jgi:hypothetical protein
MAAAMAGGKSRKKVSEHGWHVVVRSRGVAGGAERRRAGGWGKGRGVGPRRGFEELRGLA